MISTIPPKVIDKPTNRDLMRETLRLHECLHSVGSRVNDMASTVETVRLDLEHVKGVQEGITMRLGVPNATPAQVEQEGGKPIKKALIMGNMSKSQLAFTLLGSTTGIVVIYKIMAAVVPITLLALHHALMAAH